MTKPAGRVTDIGIGTCSAHSSTKSIVTIMNTGAPTALVNGLAVTTRITIGLSSCGHLSTVLTHSVTVVAEENGIHRVGDVGALPGGTYILATGSPDSNVGD